MRRLIAILAVALAMATAPQALADGQPFAPIDRPGPPLTVAAAALRASLRCQPGVTAARVSPVLLSPGTGTSPEQAFGWNWEPALDKLGIPWCVYAPPHHTLGDIQTSGEYLVSAIRTMHALAQRPIAILGHSQGGCRCAGRCGSGPTPGRWSTT